MMFMVWTSINILFHRGLGPSSTDKYFDPDFDWFSESHLFWTDYSTDFTLDPRSGMISGSLGTEETAASHFIMVSYDDNGKMVECTAWGPSAPMESLPGSSDAANLKAFLLDEGYAPVCTPYLGKAA